MKLLKQQYNSTLARYKKMEIWIETASEEEQLKYHKNVFDVIKDCNHLLNEIKKLDSLVTANEILSGFKGV